MRLLAVVIVLGMAACESKEVATPKVLTSQQQLFVEYIDKAYARGHEQGVRDGVCMEARRFLHKDQKEPMGFCTQAEWDYTVGAQ